MQENQVLVVEDLSKTYKSGDRSLTVLNNVSFSMRKGDTLSVVGPSGSGKTTLLGLTAGLDTPSRGSVLLCGINMGPLSEDERAAVRNKHVGFVFQSFQLIPTLSAVENVMVPAELQGNAKAGSRAKELLDQVGLSERMHHYPAQLSGGEQQRVSLARAFINEPDILFADEPTGNLDDETGSRIEELIFSLNRLAQTTLVLVTHDMDLAMRTGRVLQLKGGEIVRDFKPEEAQLNPIGTEE